MKSFKEFIQESSLSRIKSKSKNQNKKFESLDALISSLNRNIFKVVN